MILQLLNVLIGLSLVYVIFSTLASAFFELIENIFKQRGRLLARGIGQVLDMTACKAAAAKANATNALTAFYEHPLINALFDGTYTPEGRNLPSYIPPERFARTVLLLAEDAAGSPAASDNPFVKLKTLAERLLARQTLAQGQSHAQALEAMLVEHFNASMDRVSGWFARYARWVLLLIGLLLAMSANVDTIRIIRTLAMDPVLAERIADSAASYVEQRSQDSPGAALCLAAPTPAEAPADGAPQGKAGTGDFDQQLCQIRQNRLLAESLGLPLGWKGDFGETLGKGPGHHAFWLKSVGLLLTALALSFGAAFWFDLLSQLVKLRSAVKPDPEPEPVPPKKPPQTGANADP